MKVSFVIPNYNGEKILAKNLPHVVSVSGDAEIVIVDDASADRSIEVIKNYNGKIKIIQNEKNMGFASTVNRGVDEASGELIVLLNTDVVPKEGFLEAALPHFEDPKVFAVGFLQKCYEEGKLVLRGRGIGKFLRGFLIHSRGEVNKDNTLWVNGGAGVFRKKIWLTLGGMNPLYNPFYWEDIDISYRALKTGYKLIFEKKSVVFHHQDYGAIRSGFGKEDVKKIAYRNQIIFVWLNITDIYYLIEHFIFLPYHLLKAVITFDMAFIYGFFSAINRLNQILKERKRNKFFFKITDDEVLKNFISECRF